MTERRTALITGATRGIGRATALALARRGYDVAITGRTQHEGDPAKLADAEAMPELKKLSGSLDSAAAGIEEAGGRAFPFVLDLLDRDHLVEIAERAIDALGHIDVLLNNAYFVGPANYRRFLDATEQDVDNFVFANLTAQLVFTQPVLRHMVERGGGFIGFTGSGAGYAPPPGPVDSGKGWALLYGVPKAGLHRIPAQLVVEYADAGIRTLTLQPGAVATEKMQAADNPLVNRAAPLEPIGETFARIIEDDSGEFPNGSLVEVQAVARGWGLLP